MYDKFVAVSINTKFPENNYKQCYKFCCSCSNENNYAEKSQNLTHFLFLFPY